MSGGRVGYSRGHAHVGQRAVERDAVARHQVELVDLEHLLRLVLLLRLDMNRLAHLPWTRGRRQQSCNRTDAILVHA